MITMWFPSLDWTRQYNALNSGLLSPLGGVNIFHTWEKGTSSYLVTRWTYCGEEFVLLKYILEPYVSQSSLQVGYLAPCFSLHIIALVTPKNGDYQLTFSYMYNP